jgi:hypothetical protein
LTVTVILVVVLPHVSVKRWSPKSFITIDSLPDVNLSPDQAPEAVQDDVLVLDQVIFVDSSTITVSGFADIDAVAGVAISPLT